MNATPIKCSVLDCSNNTSGGRLIGSLCGPCYEFISKGTGVHSQAYRNALKVALNSPELEIHCKQVDTYEVSLYIGSCEGYGGKEFTEADLYKSIGAFQQKTQTRIPVRITPTRYVDGSYTEKGWECTAICYPRVPQHPETISNFMSDLAQHLLVLFRQNRISVKGPSNTKMYYTKEEEGNEQVSVQMTTIKDGYL